MTGYVTTRYYRAPEVILLWRRRVQLLHRLNNSTYCTACTAALTAPPMHPNYSTHPQNSRSTTLFLRATLAALRLRCPTTTPHTLHSRCNVARCDVARYTPALDMWSVGCILAQLLTNEGEKKNKKNWRVLFPGKDYARQLVLIADQLGRQVKLNAFVELTILFEIRFIT